MAYEPKEWQCGETITADDLNHLEQGVLEASSGGTGTETVMLRVGYDYTEHAHVVDLDELRSVYTALENNDKTLLIQFCGADSQSQELQGVLWVAPATYVIDPIENNINISASNIDDGGNVEVMNLGWYTNSDVVGGGVNTYQLTASN